MALQSFFLSARWDAARLMNHWIKPTSLKLTQLTLNKKQRHYFADKGPSSQSYGFSSSHVQMWELDHKEGWMPKNGFFQTVVLEKTLESPLDCKEIKPVNPKGNHPWIFIGRTDALILWPPDGKKSTHWKRPWCWEGLQAGGEGGNRGWDGWLASPTQWAWIWANSGR